MLALAAGGRFVCAIHDMFDGLFCCARERHLDGRETDHGQCDTQADNDASDRFVSTVGNGGGDWISRSHRLALPFVSYGNLDPAERHGPLIETGQRMRR